jgi:hypothetical protein
MSWGGSAPSSSSSCASDYSGGGGGGGGSCRGDNSNNGGKSGSTESVSHCATIGIGKLASVGVCEDAQGNVSTQVCLGVKCVSSDGTISTSVGVSVASIDAVSKSIDVNPDGTTSETTCVGNECRTTVTGTWLPTA